MSAKGESSCTERGVDPKELLAAINMVMRNSKEFWFCAHTKHHPNL